MGIRLFPRSFLIVETTSKSRTLKLTIAAPEGTPMECEDQRPKNTESSENTIAIMVVDLNDHPTFMAAATGMIIIEEMSNTPTDSSNTETTTESITMNKI